MKKAVDPAVEFSNYTSFEYHFQPVEILKIGRDDYAVFYGGTEHENQIQRGGKEYINGWLYGAVQTACGQIRKKEGA